MNKTELQSIANSVFERYPKVNKVFVATDGQAFFDEVYAKNHATVKDLDIEVFRRNDELDMSGIDLEKMDRSQLESFITENKLKVKFDEKTSDDNLRKAITSVVEEQTKKVK